MPTINLSINNTQYNINLTNQELVSLQVAFEKANELIQNEIIYNIQEIPNNIRKELPNITTEIINKKYETKEQFIENAVSQWALIHSSNTIQIENMILQCIHSWNGTSEQISSSLTGNDLKSYLKSYTADKRWQLEIAGTSWNNLIINTGREDQIKLIAEFVAISAGLRINPSKWKFRNDTVLINNQEMGEVILAARNYISILFDIEAEIYTKIDTDEITTIQEIDNYQWL